MTLCGDSMNKQEPMVFFGSGPVAAESLGLLNSDYEIEAIVTKPATLQEMQRVCPDAPVYAVNNQHELDELIRSAGFNSKYGLLVDFGIIVSKVVIDAFPLGIINSHFSILPQWRGADPITFAILSGQRDTGVSLMLLVETMDEGPLLAQATYAIPAGTTTPMLTAELTELSDAMLKMVVPMYLQGIVVPVAQQAGTILQDKNPTYSRRLTKEDGIIDWAKPASQLEREVRAFTGWPKSRTQLAGKEVIITETRAEDRTGKPGTVIVSNKQLFVYCGEGALEILRLKPIGKSDMPAEAFLAGYRNLL
jgi:methionyl-tRNA formyltransferase